MSAWIDITHPLTCAMPAWPGDPPFLLTWKSHIGAQSESAVSAVSMSSHFGTHLDAPAHFIAGGRTVDEADLQLLIGPAYLLDARGAGPVIDVHHLAAIARGVRRVLIRTANETRRDGAFHDDYAALTCSAVAHLADLGVEFIGIDAPAFARIDQSGDAHRLFLGNDRRLILENARLDGLKTGWYDMICLPLKTKGAEGAPVRAVVRPSTDKEQSK